MMEPYSLKKEEEIRAFWKKEKIREKARKAQIKSKKKFYLMDGPPYASGNLHIGTALTRTLKDVAIRSKRMQGFHAFDRAGFDTHGVPIEYQVEKQHGFKNKQDIEAFGVEKFIQECKKFATQHIGKMSRDIENLGVWMDFTDPYITYHDDYIETIWWTLKQAHKKGLLYLGKYSVHACPRCDTSVAFNEIEYQKQTDHSIYVKFPLKNEKNIFLIIWTTTPWTLPANTGVMVNPKFEYVYAKTGNGETWIVAKEKAQSLFEKFGYSFTEEKIVKGKELEGLNYENPLQEFLKLPELKNSYKVVLSERYVNLEEGTGIVHCAPGHGKEDFEVGQKNKLDLLVPVELNGTMKAEAGKYAGQKARQVDKEITEDLRGKNMLVMVEPYTHDYPICWRCKTPLLMLASNQWYLKIEDIHQKLLEFNEKVQWQPKWAQTRMKNWLEGISDWPISRKRYWGTPLPIWTCSSCKHVDVVESVAELEKVSGKKVMGIHKPEIDQIIYPCQECKTGKMTRVEEVLDVWFDSGVSSWAALGYPKNKKLFEEFWPADFNVEGRDQFRGWWNSQLILSTIAFGKAPFKAIELSSFLMGMGKVKMSKSIGNIVSPEEFIQKYNRDYLRYFLTSISTGEDVIFDWTDIEGVDRTFKYLANSITFAQTYLKLEFLEEMKNKKLAVEDQWLVSRVENLIQTVMNAYNGYNHSAIPTAINQFVAEDLSKTYIKMIRNRADEKDSAVQDTLNFAFSSILKLLAPITPHAAEYFYQQMNGKEASIHFLQLPEYNQKMHKEELQKGMVLVQEIIQNALSLREEQKLRLRWPLKELIIEGKEKELKPYMEVLKKMVNVKKVSFASKTPDLKHPCKKLQDLTFYLDISAEQGLKDEWEFMELRRKVQDLRKKLNFNPKDVGQLFIGCSDEKFIQKFKKQLEEETSTKISPGKGIMEKVLEREFFIELKK